MNSATIVQEDHRCFSFSSFEEALKKYLDLDLDPKDCRYNMYNQNGQIICIGDDNDSFWNFLNKVFMSRMVGWVDGVISFKFLFQIRDYLITYNISLGKRTLEITDFL